MGLHKEVRLEPTISFNSKWFVCNGTQQMHSACPATLNVIGYANKCKHLGILWNWVRSLDCNSKYIGFAVSFCIEYLYKPASCYDTLSLTSCCFRGGVQCKIQCVFLAIICGTVSQEITGNSLITFSFSSKATPSIVAAGLSVSHGLMCASEVGSVDVRTFNSILYASLMIPPTTTTHLKFALPLYFYESSTTLPPPGGRWEDISFHNLPSFWVTFIKALGAVWSLCTFYFNHVSMSETSPDCIFFTLVNPAN